MNTKEIYQEVNDKVLEGNVFEEFSNEVFLALDKSIQAKQPILLSGDQAVGKTFGVKWYAFKNNYDIISLNASLDLRLSEKAYPLLRSCLLGKQSKIRIILIDEVEKDSNIGLLKKFIEANKKTAFKTKNIFVCITNHYWTMKEFVSVFGSFHTPIVAPYKNKMKKYFRQRKIPMNKDIERDLRFFENVLKTNQIPKSGISDNTFEAIRKFLQSSYKDRDIFELFQNLSSPYWKWIIYNMIHGTLQYREGNFMTSLKHNSSYFFQALQVCSQADYYKNWKMLDFSIPQKLMNLMITHPSSLDKNIKSF